MDGASLEFGMSKPVTALRLISSGLFCHSSLRSDIETSYENPTTETNMNILEVIFETTLICREGFSTARHDPPCIPGPLVILQPDGVTLQAPPDTAQYGTGRPTELLIPIARA